MPTHSHNPPVIVGLGEVLWDLLPSGPKFGGAPANFACHAAALGAHVHMVSSVGNDDFGRNALTALKSHQVSTQHLAIHPSLPTGTVNVQLDAQGKPTFTINPNAAWDEIRFSTDLQSLSQSCSAVCFGSLGQRSPVSRTTIHEFLRHTPPSAWRVFDVNLRRPFYTRSTVIESLRLSNVLKLNDEELPVLAGWLSLQGTSHAVLSKIADIFDLHAIALTRGSAGSWLWRRIPGSHRHEESNLPGLSVTVVDTIGAGDSFTAAFTLGLIHSLKLDIIHQHASRIASFVCTQPGATPQLPPELRSLFLKSA